MSARAALLVVALLVAGCSGDDEPSDTPAATTTSVVPAEPPAAFGEATEPVVVGHRGAAGHFPDNTLEAFAGAAELGADWVELDVRLSSDGQAVLSHDPETEDGTVVATSTAEELGLPTLLEALEVIDEHGLGVDVEIKSDPSEATYDPSLAVVEEAMANLIARPISGPIVVTSFDRAAIDLARELTEDRFPTALIAGGIGGADELKADLLALGHDGVVLNHEGAEPGVVRTLSTGGLTLWVYTLDDPGRAAELVEQGVTGIVTDLPDVISEALG